MKNDYILFIDSGVGGLTTLAETHKILPANYIYFADNNNAPYGNHSKDEILRFIIQIILQVQQKYTIKMVVLACNTATTATIAELRTLFNFPIVGTEPAIRLAKNKGFSKICALTTPTTKKQSQYKSLKKQLNTNIKTISIPSFAQNIEKFALSPNLINYIFVLQNVCQALSLSKNNDVIVLGCTHYVLIKNIFKKFTNKDIIDGNFGVAKQILTKNFHSIKTPLEKNKIVFMFSHLTTFVKQNYQKIFGQILANL